jgi:two-component system, response regulator YesN
MHSVMVVDDEPFVRLSIASLADWEAEGFDFSFEASNGEEALKLLALRPEIDIVLLDLSMPVMDGLEFLARLRPFERAGPSPARAAPAVIVLSAHDDFHLVREAFKLGAGDYLLKAELEAEALRAALAKACAGLSESRDGTVAILERRQVESLKAQVLRDLLSGPPSEEIAESFSFLGISLGSPFSVVTAWIEDFDAVELRWRDEGLSRFSDMLFRSLSQVLSSRYRGELLLLRPSQAVAFVSGPPSRPERTEADAAAFCEDAREYLERYLSLRSSFCASPACSGPEEAAEAYRGCKEKRSVESRIVVLAKRAIRERFTDPAFSLEEAGSRAGVSPNHLSFEFSRETGETFSSYLSRLRMDEAKRLLASTDLMVYEVGERVGYPSVEHFSRTFKRMVGTSPARFKATRGEGADGEGLG